MHDADICHFMGCKESSNYITLLLSMPYTLADMAHKLLINVC